MRARSLLASLLIILVPGLLAAQQRVIPREGFFIAVGTGFGGVAIDGENFYDDEGTGASGNLRLGGTLNPNWRLGAMTVGWVGDGVAAYEGSKFSALLFIAEWFPKAESNWHLRAGVGGGQWWDDTDITDVGGAVFLIGGGIDLPVGEKVAISPYLHLVSTTGGEDYWGYSADVGMWQIGATVTWP